MIEGVILRLESLKSKLDLRAIAMNRAEAGQRATFEPGKEAILARRYEAAAERSMCRALYELRQIDAQGIESIASSLLLASFRNEGSNPAAQTLASFCLDALGPLELPPVPTQTPLTAALAAREQVAAANNPALVGFVPPGQIMGSDAIESRTSGRPKFRDQFRKAGSNRRR